MKVMSIIGIVFGSFLLLLMATNIGSNRIDILQGTIIWGMLGVGYFIAFSITSLVKKKG